MIQIDKDEIAKILSIDKKYIPDSIVEKLAGVEMYYDTELSEHLYTLEETLYTVIWTEEEYKVIMQIAEACNENEAAYWRIINQ